MARTQKHLVGLDIDPAGISAAEVAVNGRLAIKRAAFAALEPGIVRDGEIVDVDALTQSLREFYRQNRGLPKRVRIGLANQKIAVRVVELPPVQDAKQFETAVRFVAQDQIPMPIDTAVLDFQPLDAVETEAGPRQRALVVAARRDVVDRLLTAVRDAGLRPLGIDLSAFAMIRALYRSGAEAEAGSVLYLGVGGMVNVAVARGRTCLFTRASSGGFETLAAQLAERRQLTLEHARGWLVHVGMEAPVEELEGDPEIVATARDVLLQGVRAIATDVRQSLDFHAMQDAVPAVSRAVVTGAAVAVPGFAAMLASELGLPVEVGVVEGAPDGVGAGAVTIAAGLAVEEVAA